MGCTRLVVAAIWTLLLAVVCVSSQSLKPTVRKVSILDLLADSPELKAKLDARLKDTGGTTAKGATEEPALTTASGRRFKNSRLPSRLKSHKKPASNPNSLRVQGESETVATTTVRNSRRGFRLPSRNGSSSQGGLGKATASSLTSTRRRTGARRGESQTVTTSSTIASQGGLNNGRQRNARFGGSRLRAHSRTTTPSTAAIEDEKIDVRVLPTIDEQKEDSVTENRPRIRNGRLPPGLRRRNRLTKTTTTTTIASSPDVVSEIPPIDNNKDVVLGEDAGTTSKAAVEATTITVAAPRRNARRFPILRRRS